MAFIIFQKCLGYRFPGGWSHWCLYCCPENACLSPFKQLLSPYETLWFVPDPLFPLVLGSNCKCTLFSPRTSIFAASNGYILLSSYAFWNTLSFSILFYSVCVYFDFVSWRCGFPFVRGLRSMVSSVIYLILFMHNSSTYLRFLWFGFVRERKKGVQGQLPHISHYSDGSHGCCPVIVLAPRSSRSALACCCRCRFPMSTFIYANLISILNVVGQQSECVCVSCCVWVCARKIHFGLPILAWFYLPPIVLQLLWVAQVFFRYCFLSALISEWDAATLPPTCHTTAHRPPPTVPAPARPAPLSIRSMEAILLHCGVKIVCLLIENDIFFVLPRSSFACLGPREQCP